MKKYLWLSLIVLFIASCASNLITAARIAESRNEYMEAIKHCTNELKTNPKNVEAYLIMARCNVALGKYLEASDNIDAGYEINKLKTEAQITDPKDRPNYFAVYKTAAFALLEQKKFDEALKKAERARYLDSTRAESYVLIGLVWSQRKDPVKMQQAFARAQQLDPNAPEPYLYLGHRYYDETKWDSALFNYEKAIGLFSKKRDNALKTIMAKTPALKPDEVAAKLVALQLGGKQAELDEYVKKTLLREGGVVEISRQMESVVNAHINLTVAFFRAAACAYNSGKIDKAAANFESLLKLEPDNRDGLYYYGQVLVTKLQFAKAAEVFGKLVVLDPKDKESLFSLGYAYLKMNEFDKVIETLEDKYLALDSTNGNVYINLALAYKGKGNAKKAYEYIKKAEELEKNKPKK